MITCPKCSKEIADDSAHCGYCGQEIKEKVEKKTMFGMAALDGAMLQKAVAEAQAAKDAAQKGVKLPKPAGGVSTNEAPAPDASGGGAGLKLPRPGERSGAQPSTPSDDIGLAQTEMLEFNDQARADLRHASEQAKRAATPAGGVESADEGAGGPTAPQAMPSMPDFEAPAGGEFASQDEFGQQDAFGSENMGQQDSFGPEGGVEQPQSAAPEGGFGTEGEESYLVEADTPQKSKKGLFIAIGAFVLLAGGGCFIGVGYWLYSNMSSLFNG